MLERFREIETLTKQFLDSAKDWRYTLTLFNHYGHTALRMLQRFVPGQRWLSQTEPELGLGLVIKTEPDKVTIVFPSSETTRVYTVEAPPLTRVRFSVGDVLKTQDGKSFVVEDLSEQEGRVTYVAKGKKIDESRLSDSLTFSKPIDRLLNGQVDDKSIYNLRHRALYRRFKTFRSPLRGLLGGRFLPTAHQLYVAIQATRAVHPRVLLTDEPGLGRRVEAGLILQRLQTNGQAQRVLLLAPEADLVRMETELRRRFDFTFTRLTEDELSPPTKPAKKAAAKTAKVKDAAPPPNPFVDAGVWLSCPLEIFKAKSAHAAAAVEWDVLVVDGAEGLEYDESSPGQSYRAVEEVAAKAKGLVVVSGVGPETDPGGHFGRIRLLDPEEFPTARRYHKHQKDLEATYAAVEKIAAAEMPDRETEGLLKPFGTDDAKVKDFLKSWKDGREGAKDHLLEYLLDGQECGRFVFHNVRDQLSLPPREVEFVRLEAKPEVRDGLREEFKLAAGAEPSGKVKSLPSAADSALALWVSSLVSPPILPPVPVPPRPPGMPAPAEPVEPPPPPPPPPKALVVCANRGRAMAAAKALTKKVPDKIVLVTDGALENIPLDSCAVVVGADDALGRGFHSWDTMILWDLPSTLEAARAMCSLLDFSGGATPVRIVAPYVEDTPQELEARWLHEGLDALCASSQAQDSANEEFAKPAHEIAKRVGVRHNPKLLEEIKALAKKTRSAVESATKKLEKHRDRILEIASYRTQPGEQAYSRMHSSDEDLSLDLFANRVLEHCGLLVEVVEPRCAFVKWNPEAPLRLEDVPKEGLRLTYYRKAALRQESAHFLTWDHPLVASATERLLATAIGNTAYVVWEDERAQLVLLEGIYIAEPEPGQSELQVGKFMPPTPVRVVVSHELEDLSSQYTTELVNKNVRNGRREWLRNNARPLHNLIPGMLRNLHQRAEIKMQELATKASNQMETILTGEMARLGRLPETKRRKAAIAGIEVQIAELKKLLAAPVLSLDSLRLIRRGPSGKGI